MKNFLNVGHCQFNVFFNGNYQTLIGKMTHCDDTGITICKEDDGTYHSYAPGVVQHICLAP